MEIWKDIPGYEGYYQASNLGRIKSIRRKGRQIERIFQPGDSRGYRVVCLRKDGVQKTIQVHILVARAFIGKMPDGMETNHINGKRNDNHLDNLEYCTPRENMLHSYSLGRISVKGERNGCAKLSAENVLEIRSLHATGKYSLMDLAIRFKVSKATISDAVSRRCWKHI